MKSGALMAFHRALSVKNHVLHDVINAGLNACGGFLYVIAIL